jgi:hypothetical protein
MSFSSGQERSGMQKVSQAIGYTLNAMGEHCREGMPAKALDDFGN